MPLCFTTIHCHPSLPSFVTNITYQSSFLHLFINFYILPQSTYFFFLTPVTHPSSPTSFPPSTCPPALPQLLHYGEHGRLLNIRHSGQITQPAMPANDHYYSRQCQRQNLNLVQLADGGEVKKAREGDREVGCRPVCLH